MKIQNLVAVAAIGLSASTAWAQSHPTAGSPIATATVGSVFVPKPGTSVAGVARGGGVTVSAPASTPVSVPATAAAAVAAGAPAAVASFTQSLGAAGVPAAAAQGIATALQQLSASPTVGTVATAIASWNATLATLTPTQVQAMVNTPAGRAAVRTMVRAFRGAQRAR
ncbi:MAG: hypothetical protein FJ363_12360 [Gemmatimonadetes bacterium]|nr:hypothetical protein [Gemmatimonadota bacterium]